MAAAPRSAEPLDGLLRLTISNPGKRNALDHAILDGIAGAVRDADPSRVAAIVLTGAHGMFSSGYDIGEVAGDEFAGAAERLVAHPHDVALQALDATDLPTVAALTGHTIGGGLEVALACDLRIAADGIRLGMPPAKLGLVYSHTGLQRFVGAIGEPRTRELFLLGRHVDARTALDWGLVNDVVVGTDLEDVSLEIATELATNAPLSIAGNKRVLRALRRVADRVDPQTERDLLELRRASFHSEDLREG